MYAALLAAARCFRVRNTDVDTSLLGAARDLPDMLKQRFSLAMVEKKVPPVTHSVVRIRGSAVCLDFRESSPSLIMKVPKL